MFSRAVSIEIAAQLIVSVMAFEQTDCKLKMSSQQKINKLKK